MAETVDVADLAVNFVSTGSRDVLGAIQGVVSGLSGALGPIGMVGGAVAAVSLGVAAASIKMAGDFQAGMTSLVTGAGESEKNLGLVSNGILQLAVDTGTSTSQLTAGMYMIESAGFHGANGLNILKAAAEGAKVGNADLGTVADATTTIMKDYPNVINGASGAVNTLIATVANGKTHMQDLSQSLSTVLPTASAAKVGLNDVMGAMATMTGEGVPAANAATYLRQMITALMSPSAAASKALTGVGLSSAQIATDIQTKGLPATLQEITDAIGKKFPAGSAGYVTAVKDISGGTKTMQGMLDLTGNHLADFKTNVGLVSAAVKTGGQSITGWTAVQGDFNQMIDRGKEVVETLMIKIGTALLPVLTKLGNFVLNNVVPALMSFASWAQEHVWPALQQVGGIISTQVGPALGKMFGQIDTQLLPALGRLWNQLSPVLIPALKFIASVLVNEVVPAFTTGINTVTTIIGIVSNLIDMVNNLINTMNKVKNAVGGALGGVGNFFSSIGSHIPGFAMGVKDYSGGLAVVGEQGPELVYLPAGSSVVPQSTRNLGSGVPLGSQQQQAPVNLYVDGRLLASTVWQNTPRAVNIATGYKG